MGLRFRLKARLRHRRLPAPGARRPRGAEALRDDRRGQRLELVHLGRAGRAVVERRSCTRCTASRARPSRSSTRHTCRGLRNTFQNEALCRPAPARRHDAASSVAPVASGYERSLRPCLALADRTRTAKHHSETRSRLRACERAPPDRAAPGAVLHGAPRRVSAARREHGRAVVDLGRGNPDVPPPPHVVDGSSRRRASRPRRPRLRAVRGPARAERGDRRALPRRVRRELDPDARGRGRPGDEDGARRARPRAGRARRRRSGAGSRLPRLPLGASRSPARGAAAAARPPRAGRRTSTRAPREDVAALYLNYPSNPCAASAPRASSRRRSRRRATPALRSCTTSPTATSSSTGAGPRASSPTPGAREVGVELFSMSKSYGMAGWRLGFVARERGDRRARRAAPGPRPRRDLRAGPGGRDRRAHRLAGHGRGAARALRGAARPRARRARLARAALRGHVLRLAPPPDGVARRRLLARARVALAPGEGFGERGRG